MHNAKHPVKFSITKKNDTMIKLIVGLGNPGTEYIDTRHNAGFWLVERYAQRANTVLRLEKPFHGLVAKGRVAGQEVFFLEPQTYMNRSGQAVGALAKFYKIAPEEILVVHDELDLSPGTARLKKGGGAGGHNGLKDITAHLGTQDYWRLRIGIGHPRDLRPEGAPAGNKDEVANYVLKAPGKEAQRAIDSALERCEDVTELLLKGDMVAAMQQLHSPT